MLVVYRPPPSSSRRPRVPRSTRLTAAATTSTTANVYCRPQTTAFDTVLCARTKHRVVSQCGVRVRGGAIHKLRNSGGDGVEPDVMLLQGRGGVKPQAPLTTLPAALWLRRVAKVGLKYPVRFLLAILQWLFCGVRRCRRRRCRCRRRRL